MVAQIVKYQKNQSKMDKFHIFVVNMFDNFDKYMKVSRDSSRNKLCTPVENLEQWLTDKNGRDSICYPC